MVSFAPIRWERGSENALSGLTVSEGGYRMRIMHQIEITEDQQNDSTIAQKDRPSEIIVEEEEEDDGTVVEPEPEPTEPADDEDEDFEVLDDTPLINAERVNWDGEVVVAGEIPW